MDRTLALGIGIGSGYLFETTFIREATSDLTGERGSLMGAIQGLLLAQYEVLRENGHTPSEAFNETVEELTQSLMPLFAKNGMGLDVRKLLYDCPAWRFGLDGSVPRRYQAGCREIVRLT